MPRAAQKKKPETREIAAAKRDLDLFAGWMARRDNPDAVLRAESRGRGVRAYEDLERDDQVSTCLQTRRLAVTSCEWSVTPASEDDPSDLEISEFVEKVLKAASFDKASFDLLQGLLTGFKVSEIMWDVSEGQVGIKEFRGREPHRFTFDWDDNPRLLTRENMVEGEVLPVRKFQTFSYGSSSHNPFGLGLGYRLYWPVWFKKNAVKFWIIFAEKFGSPTAVGTYSTGATYADQAKLLSAIKSIQQETGIIVPEGMVISYLEAQRYGTVNTYDGLTGYMDRAIAKVTLGQTLTTEEGDSGSYALGAVHDDVRRELVKADADALCEALNNQTVRWLCDFNFPPERFKNGYPQIWRRTEQEADLKPLAERDQIVLSGLGLGAHVGVGYLADTYDIPLLDGVDPDTPIGAGQSAPPGFATPLNGGGPGGSGFSPSPTPPTRGGALMSPSLDGRGQGRMTFAEPDFDSLDLAASAAAPAADAAIKNLTDAAGRAIVSGDSPATALTTTDLSALQTSLARLLFFGMGEGLAAVVNETAEAEFVEQPLPRRMGRAERNPSFSGGLHPPYSSSHWGSLLAADAAGVSIFQDGSGGLTFNPTALPFDEAIAWFARKGVQLSPNGWRDLNAAAHARSFTVANVTAADVVTDIQTALDSALANGVSRGQFVSTLTDVLGAKGWIAKTGEPVIADGIKRLTRWRLETIYRTNLQSAFSAGRYEQQLQVADMRPYWQYMTVADGRERPEHAALHGQVWRYDHPVWDKIYPPWDYNCRCYVITLSDRQLNQRGLTPSTAGAAINPGSGFDASPGPAGLAAWKPDLTSYPPDVRAFLERTLRA